jgi:hypothetical protein
MNYIIEDNFDFFEELNKESTENTKLDNICLISNNTLDKNSITLSCNHSFNFEPLYKEIIHQKSYNNLETTRLKINEIKCPYCRQINNKLLPHIKINDKMKFIYGVNSPANYCMIGNTCSYIFKSGKNKNNCCGKPAFYSENNYYCSQHKKYAKKNIENQKTCKAILKTGKNKGLQCNCKADHNSDFCKRHNK